MVDLPAVNTPQFDWALNKMGKRPQPAPPIFQPDIPARAIYIAAFHPRRQMWAVIGLGAIGGLLVAHKSTGRKCRRSNRGDRSCPY
jgi:hypothetical protein